MRQLLILRHAKTERSNAGGDHARRLIERGRADAARMGDYLLEQGLKPAMALVSDATRARETFEALARAFNAPVRTSFDRALYLAAPDTLIDALREAPDDCQTLLLVGHNPGLHELAYNFSDSGESADVDALATKFPTCALAVITFETTHWRDIASAPARLERFVTARSLRPEDNTGGAPVAGSGTHAD